MPSILSGGGPRENERQLCVYKSCIFWTLELFGAVGCVRPTVWMIRGISLRTQRLAGKNLPFRLQRCHALHAAGHKPGVT